MTTEKSAIALRILTAINKRTEPDPKDVSLLQSYYPAFKLDPDELACMAIQEALRNKAYERHRAANSR